jgi:hypothetical protein
MDPASITNLVQLDEVTEVNIVQVLQVQWWGGRLVCSMA